MALARTPESGTPDGARPDSSIPDGAIPDGAIPDGVIPDGVIPDGDAPVVIDCDDCAVRGHGCHDCVVSVLLGVPETLLRDERAALDVLAEVGLVPRLRLVPIRRDRDAGVA